MIYEFPFENVLTGRPRYFQVLPGTMWSYEQEMAYVLTDDPSSQLTSKWGKTCLCAVTYRGSVLEAINTK